MTKRRAPGSAHAALDRLVHDAGGAQSAADLIGVSRYHVQHATDPDDGRDLPFRQVAILTRLTRSPAAAEHLATCAGGVFIPINAGSAPLARLTGDGLSATANAAARVLEAESAASSGGCGITPADAAEIAALIDDTLHIFGRARAAAQAIIDGETSDA